MRDLSRRTVIARAAAAIPAAAFASVPALASGDTDSVASELIAAYKSLIPNHEALIHRQDELEAALPIERRRTSMMIYHEEIVESDDPRWIALKRGYMAHDRADDAACRAIAVARPTTIAGVTLLMRYAVEDEIDLLNSRWGFEENGKSISIGDRFLMGMADALDRIAAGAA